MTDPNIIQFEGGDVLAAEEPLTIRGLLLPYNEEGRTNVGRFMVEAGTVEIPTDVSVMNATNLDHIGHEGRGRVTALTDTPQGVFASIKFADTPEGRAAYDDAINPNGKRRKLSAEFGPAVIKAGKLVAGHAKLWGSALVEAGAFPSAQVLAADTPTPPDPTQPPAAPDQPTETVAVTSEEFTDESGKTMKRTTTTTTRTEPDGEGGTKTTITEKTVIEEPDPTPPTDPQQENTMLPNTITPTQVQARKADVNLPQVFAAIAAFKANPLDAEAHQVLAALSDITIGGSNALPASGVLRENWLGQLYQGIPYARQYVTLGKLGTNISAAGKKGFTVHRGTTGSPVNSFASTGGWAGNKAAVGSGRGFTETAASILHRFAFAGDFGREFWDLPGGAEVVEAFLSLILEDHLVWSDEKARLAWISAAGAPVAPATYPSEYNDSIGALLQGIIAVKAKKADKRSDKPTFAIANAKAYEELVYTPKDLVPEFIKFSINTDGSGLADGDVLVVSGDNGIVDTAAVTVGADYAIEFDELAGGPLKIDALEIAKGGIDKAVHGYLQEFTVRPEAVKVIGVPDTRANSTAYDGGRIIKASSTVYMVVPDAVTMAGGTTGSSAPSAPAVGATVTDGTATLLRLA
jgi:hypothetical protein